VSIAELVRGQSIGNSSMKITLKAIVITVAIAMSAFAGVVATMGLMTLVPGAKVMVGTLGGLLEAGQLVAFAWLSTNWRNTNVAVGIMLAGLAFTVVMLDGIGISAQLSSSFMGKRNAGQVEATKSYATVDAKIEAAKAEVADFDRQLAMVDGQIAKANEAKLKARDNRERIKAAQAAIVDSETKRTNLTTRREAAVAKLTALQIDRGTVKGREIEMSGEFVAVQFVAAVLAIPEDRVMQIMFVIFGYLPNLFAWALVAVCHGKEHKSEALAKVEAPVIVTKSQPTPEQRSKRARQGWETRRRKVREAAIAASGIKVVKVK
jgi:hypothetical protein